MSEILKDAKPSSEAINAFLKALDGWESSRSALFDIYAIDVAPLIAERDALKVRVAEVEKERDDARANEERVSKGSANVIIRAEAVTDEYLARAEAAESSLAASRRQVEGLREIIRKTRDLVSQCAAEGFVYDKAPISELMDCFCLTRAGAESALGPGETLDEEDFPR